MNARSLVFLFTLSTTAAMHGRAAEAQKPDVINDYLANIGPGATSAGDILGLSGSVINSVYSAKDLVGAIQTASGDRSKGGFGISFTPARSSIESLAMPMERYLEKGDGLSRIWGNTSFSYAQNKTTLGGADYNQDAIAVRAVLYMDNASDPVVAAHEAFQNAACRKEAAPDLLLAAVKAEETRLGRPLVQADRDRIREQLKKQAPIREALVKDADVQAECIRTAARKASARWNATQVSAMAGQGWIRGTSPGSEKLSLARHVSLIGAWGPNESSLLNLTVRRVDRDLVLDTLTKTPTYKSFTLAAARYTLGIPGKSDMYALVEVSNVRKAENTLSNGAFKSALGLDMKAGENIWLEFRIGRSRTSDGQGNHTAALMTFKIAPSSGLDTLKR